ncbi:Flp pilus assembly protein CpaB [Roseovarius sp. EL26]|uniref:Flp pilus assembly protein CpaB n=1 Tax=Roseovarius sp. EL26 TaxID=2126672 RepID=UPI000EA2EA3F|nr:Flp pilus assembly protein CpaB [Roseovarius sp. EL26]
MRLVFGLVLVLGLGLAGFAVYMAKNYIQGYQAQLAHERAQRKPNIETVNIYVAKNPLRYGDQLDIEDTALIAFPKASLPNGYYDTEDALFPNANSAPRKILRAIEPNEAILEIKVTKPGEEAGITSQLQKGMRAFAIKVDIASGVSGFLRPGDQVDVYWTGNIGRNGARTEGNSTGAVTKLIQSGVKLIAVDQVSNSDTTGAILARTVTVSARPQQVAALAQAQSTGRLSLSLVGAGDETLAEVIEVDQRSLLGLAEVAVEKKEAPVAKKQVCTIKTRRGGEVISTPIPCTN